MALFGRDKGSEKASHGKAETHPIVGLKAWCRVCDAERTFSRAWRRTLLMHECPNCQLAFDPGQVYKKHQPVCPRCNEPLEQPGFDYGLCDTCGSKFELVEGTKPGWLPNSRQRMEMDKHGKAWTRD